jgi:hypothetical protein
MELKSSLPHSQVPATCPYPEPDQYYISLRKEVLSNCNIMKEHNWYQMCRSVNTGEHHRASKVQTTATLNISATHSRVITCVDSVPSNVQSFYKYWWMYWLNGPLPVLNQCWCVDLWIREQSIRILKMACLWGWDSNRNLLNAIGKWKAELHHRMFNVKWFCRVRLM